MRTVHLFCSVLHSENVLYEYEIIIDITITILDHATSQLVLSPFLVCLSVWSVHQS